MIALLLGLIMIAGLVSAHAKESPASRFYGLRVALDRLSLALTFDNAARAEKALAIADERQLETQDMADQGNLTLAELAQREHDAAIQAAMNAVKSLSSDGKAANAAKAVERLSQLQDRIEQHREKALEVKQAILDNKNLSLNQSVHMSEIFSKILNKTDELALKAEQKKENALLKYSAFTNSSKEDIERLRQAIDNSTGLSDARKNRTLRQLDRAELILNRTGERLQNFTGNMTDDEREDFREGLNQTKLRLKGARNNLENESEANEVSAIAQTLGEAHRQGNFSETLNALHEQIRTRQQEHKQEINQKRNLDGDSGD